MTSKYKAIVFDMDGTLTDTMYAWRDVFKEFIANNNLEMPDELVGIPEYPVTWTAKKFASQLPHKTYDEMCEEMYKLVNEHYRKEACARTDAAAWVKRLKEKGYKLALATATPIRYADTALNRLGFEGLFELKVSPEEIGCGKDNPLFFERVAQMLGVKVEECVMFEDALYSMRSAKEAGFAVCAIEDYYAWREKEEIRQIADGYIACYADLLEKY